MASLAERFWSKVDRRGDDECWPWLAARGHAGHGNFWLNGTYTSAHRVAWALTFGPIPDELWALHRCDNPPCCNPAHLFLGDAAANNRDCRMKGRARNGSRPPRGSASPRARLTENDVISIRSAAASGVAQKALAVQYGVSAAHVSQIVLGQAWRWFTCPR